MEDLRHAAWETNIPRRRWVGVIYDAISAFEGEFYTFNMQDWYAPEVADVFGKEDDSARWVSNFAKPRGEQKPIRAFQETISNRVTLIDLYMRLVHPEKAVYFGYREAVAPQAPPKAPPPPGGPTRGGPSHELEHESSKTESFMLCYLHGVGVILLQIPDPASTETAQRIEDSVRDRAKALGFVVSDFHVRSTRPTKRDLWGFARIAVKRLNEDNLRRQRQSKFRGAASRTNPKRRKTASSDHGETSGKGHPLAEKQKTALHDLMNDEPEHYRTVGQQDGDADDDGL